MIKIKDFFPIALLYIASSLVLFSCQRDIEDLEEAGPSKSGEVFIDGFTGDLLYAAFGGSDVAAFQVVNDVTYQGNAAMSFAVPDFGDPKGAYAGGVFFTQGGRDLSGYDALTFWAKASQPANVDIFGFGNDLGENKFETSIRNVPLNTNWRKFYIPIPDPSKFTNEKGMFYFSEGPENERGYTFWVDEVQFESLGTIAHAKAQIMGGEDVVQTAETGAKFNVNALTTFNLPNGTDQEVFAASSFFNFSSTDPSVASVDDAGEVMVMDAGTATITASLGNMEAEGSLTIQSTGDPVLPLSPAPTPDEDPSDVISLFSNAYTDEPVDFYNGFWEFSTTQSEIVQVDNDDIIRYTQLNFVGIQFTSPTIDVNSMTHFHIDIWTPDNIAGKEFKVLLVDLGPDGTFEGGDNTSHEVTIPASRLARESWVSLDLPFTDFPGLTTKSNLAQVVLSGTLPNVFVDNMYFYRGGNTGGPDRPETAAPIPNVDPNDVISVFSDSYSNLANANLNPDWGQGTVVTQESIEGNNTLRYSGLNFQGLEFGENVDISSMEMLHIDYWSSNSSVLSTFLISPGPVETPYSMSVPTNGWASIDVPLSTFDPVDLMDVIQMKFEGNGTIFLDNIYFYRGNGGGGGGGDTPDMAAPTPTVDAANVISIYSDTYDNIENSNINPDWGQSTVFSEEVIDGNNTIRLGDLNYQGIEFGANYDVSGMEFVHVDIWTNNSSAFDVFLISPGPLETPSALNVPTSGWQGFDIPLTDFSGVVNLTEVFQMKFVGNGTIYMDNIYFYRN
jgi:hypothetical protein